MLIILISVVGAAAVQMLLFKYLFDDADQFFKELKNTILLFPIAIFIESLINWSPSFRNESIRVLFWIPSGTIAGLAIYFFGQLITIH